MRKISSVLALAALLGFGSSVLADETAAPAPATTGDQKVAAATTAPTATEMASDTDDKTSAETPAATTASTNKEDSSSED